MKNTTKRTLSLILIVCMLLSVIPFAASAEEPTYSWDAYEFFQEFSAGNISTIISSNMGFTTKYVDPSQTNSYLATDGYLQYQFKAADAHIGQQFATVSGGVYTVSFDLSYVSSDITLDIYVVSADDFTATNASGKNNEFAAWAANGTHKLTSIALSKDTDGDASDLTFTAKLPDQPIICITPSAWTKSTNVRFVNVSFTEVVTDGPTDMFYDLGGHGMDTAVEVDDIGLGPAIGVTSDSWTTVQTYGANIKYAGAYDKGAESHNGGYRWKFNDDNAYVAIRLDGIGSGIYDLSLFTQCSSSSASADVYLIPAAQLGADATATLALLSKDNHVGTVHTSTGFVSNSIEDVEFSGSLDGKYVLILKNKQGLHEGAGLRETFTLANITLTLVEAIGGGSEPETVYAILNGSENLTSVEAVIEALGTSGNTVKLLKDIDLGDEAFLNSGATVDLNGKKLTGASAATVTVKDTSNGGGTVAQKPTNVAAGQVALKNGDAYSVVNYGIAVDNTAIAKENNVSFWYRTTFDTATLYALAKNDSDFKVELDVTVNGVKANTLQLSDELVDAWADAMASDDGTVCFRITINGAADMNITVTPKVCGQASNSTITYSAS